MILCLETIFTFQLLKFRNKALGGFVALVVYTNGFIDRSKIPVAISIADWYKHFSSLWLYDYVVLLHDDLPKAVECSYIRHFKVMCLIRIFSGQKAALFLFSSITSLGVQSFDSKILTSICVFHSLSIMRVYFIELKKKYCPTRNQRYP